MPKRSENWSRIRPICSDLRVTHEWGGLNFTGVAPFSTASGGFGAQRSEGKLGSEGRNYNAKAWPRCGTARTAGPFRADGEGVSHTTGVVLLLLVTASLTAWCISPETVIQKRVSEVR